MSSRFWLRPKWIVGHVVCLALIVAFVNLGFWQLRRLHDRRVVNAVVRAHQRLPPTDLDDALRAGATAAEYRRVHVDGTWVADETVLVRSRSLNQQSGYDVLTPLRVDGQAVIVNRGFVPAGGGGEPAILRAVRPRTLGVEVTGILRAGEHRGSIGPRDPATGHLRVVNRIDLTRLQQQSAERLAPVYLQLRSARPAQLDLIQPIPLPATDDGPHLSYAIQWFIFATVGAVGWPLLLRRQSRDEDGEPDDEGVAA